MAPEDLVPVGAAGLDAVFVDEVPDDLFEGKAAGWEVESRERLLAGVVPRSGVHMQVAAGVARPGVSFRSGSRTPDVGRQGRG